MSSVKGHVQRQGYQKTCVEKEAHQPFMVSTRSPQQVRLTHCRCCQGICRGARPAVGARVVANQLGPKTISAHSKELAMFLIEIGMRQYMNSLLEHGFEDMETMMLMEEQHMENIGMLPGHILKLKKRLKEYRRGSAKDDMSCSDLTPSTETPSEAMTTLIPPSPSKMTISRESIDSVQASWVLVEKLGVETVAEILYKHLFNVAPQTKSLFPLSVRVRYRDWSCSEDELEFDPVGSPGLKRLFAKVIESVGTAVVGLQDIKALVPHLTALGMRHINYNMKDEYFAFGGQALMLTLQDGLGDNFTPDVKLAWGMVYDFISASIISGLHMAQAKQTEVNKLLEDMSQSSRVSKASSTGSVSTIPSSR